MTRALLVALLAAALVADPVKPKATHSKTPAGTAHVSTSKTSAHSRAGSHAVSSRTKSRRVAHAAPAPSYQLHPDAQRYTQIQQALADRGYFKGQPNGEWNEDSVDALKRFQADQKLESDGKVNALTLTGLGLGPKHDGSTASSVPLSATAPSTDPSLNPPSDPAVPDLPGEGVPPVVSDPQ